VLQKHETGLLTFGLYFSGHLNLITIVNHLKQTVPAFSRATDVLLTGDSAGGMGTFYNVDWLADTLTWATVKGVPVAGWFFPGFTDNQPEATWAPPSTYQEWINNESGFMKAELAYIALLYNSYVHPNCLENEPLALHCGTVTVLYKHIKSPLFVLQNMYDTNQLSAELLMPGCSGDSCTDNQTGYVRYFGRSSRNSIQQILTNEDKKDGFFMPSCYDHTQGINIEGKTDINGFLPTELVGNWFFNRWQGRSPIRVIDDCPADLPCNPHCNTMVPEPGPQPETKCSTELKTLCTRGTSGCFSCAMMSLRQLLAADCNINEISQLCASGTTS